jgi:hypothetical protein
LLAAGFSIAELHLEDRSSEGSDSSSEFGNSEDWETGEPVAEGGMHASQQADVAAPSSTASSSRASQAEGRAAGSCGSACSTPLHLQQQQQAADAASEDTLDSGTGLATVVLDTDAAAPTSGMHADPSASVHISSKSWGEALAGSAHSRAGVAPVGSVSAAALQLAASQPAPNSSLSVVRLAAEANRNLTGQEKKEKGGLSLLVLNSYIQAAGGILAALGVLLVIVTEQGSRVITDTFLGWWASDLFHQGLWFYIGIYACLGVLYSLLTFVR